MEEATTETMEKRDEGIAEQNDDDDDDGKARPIGDEIRESGEEKYYSGFERFGDTYELEDTVLLAPEEEREKPRVVIIKEIIEIPPDDVMLKVQMFYRPEEATKKGCINCFSVDNRELFYSFDSDEVPAEAVMHKCIIHFLPARLQLPDRTVHPGFLVQRFYNSLNQSLKMMSDECLLENQEIHRQIEKTKARFALHPCEDKDAEETANEICKNVHEVKKNSRNKCNQRSASKFTSIIKQFQAFTGDIHRDNWLVRLLEAFYINCQFNSEAVKYGDKRTSTYRKDSISVIVREKGTTISKGSEHIIWPDDAIQAAAALENAVHEDLCAKFRKYNTKLGLLQYSLQKNVPLAKRLLKRELEPSALMRMSESELKGEALTGMKKDQNPKQSTTTKNITKLKRSTTSEDSRKPKQLITSDNSPKPKQSAPKKTPTNSKEQNLSKNTPEPKQSTPRRNIHHSTRETHCFGCSERRRCNVYFQDDCDSRKRRKLECTTCGRIWGSGANEDPQDINVEVK